MTTTQCQKWRLCQQQTLVHGLLFQQVKHLRRAGIPSFICVLIGIECFDFKCDVKFVFIIFNVLNMSHQDIIVMLLCSLIPNSISQAPNLSPKQIM